MNMHDTYLDKRGVSRETMPPRFCFFLSDGGSIRSVWSYSFEEAAEILKYSFPRGRTVNLLKIMDDTQIVFIPFSLVVSEDPRVWSR